MAEGDGTVISITHAKECRFSVFNFTDRFLPDTLFN
jgi:hypothetical protein